MFHLFWSTFKRRRENQTVSSRLPEQHTVSTYPLIFWPFAIWKTYAWEAASQRELQTHEADVNQTAWSQTTDFAVWRYEEFPLASPWIQESVKMTHSLSHTHTYNTNTYLYTGRKKILNSKLFPKSCKLKSDAVAEKLRNNEMWKLFETTVKYYEIRCITFIPP